MYTAMRLWTEIRRRVLAEGLSKRQAVEEYGLHWRTLAKILEHPEAPGYRLAQLPLRGGTSSAGSPHPLLGLLPLHQPGQPRPRSRTSKSKPVILLDSPHPHSYPLPISAALFTRQALQFSTGVYRIRFRGLDASGFCHDDNPC